MPYNHGFRAHGRRQQPNKNKQVVSEKEESSPLLQAFRGYARELDEKHDRYERIIKISRDITIESKRIIFLLHTIDGRKNNRERILAEAEERLNNIIANSFKDIGMELIDQDPHQYRGAYSPGLQEFIEAFTFFEFCKYADEKHLSKMENNEEADQKCMSDWNELQQKMQYTKPAKEIEENNGGEKNEEEIKNDLTEQKTFSFFIDPTEYILGVADLTGELMRRCINSLGSGETDVCLSTCKVLQQFYAGYISLYVFRCRDLSRKIATMRQSVLKSEQVCYNVKVRGGEAAKWGAMYDNKAPDDVDEGYF